MSDTIEFPLNDRTYYRKARDYANDQEYAKAVDAITKVKDDNSAVSYLHAFALYNLDEIEEALEVAEKFKDYYINDEKHALFYVLLLIENKIFLEAEAVISKYLPGVDSPFHKEWVMLNIELNNKRESYNQEIEKIKSDIRAALLEIDSYSTFEQASIIKQASMLVLEDLQIIAQNIFNNFNISPHNQRAFLEILIEKKDETEYIFNWFNQPKRIVPNQLNQFEDMPILDEIQETLNLQLEKSPHLVEGVFNEIVSDLLLLYPFAEDIIVDVPYWVASYVQQFSESSELSTEEMVSKEDTEMMIEWLDLLNKMANRTN